MLGSYQGSSRNSFLKLDQIIDLNRCLTKDDREDGVFWWRPIYTLTCREWFYQCSQHRSLLSSSHMHVSGTVTALKQFLHDSWKHEETSDTIRLAPNARAHKEDAFSWSICLNVITAVIFLAIMKCNGKWSVYSWTFPKLCLQGRLSR